jgi:hypothetical protein
MHYCNAIISKILLATRCASAVATLCWLVAGATASGQPSAGTAYDRPR